MKVGDLVRAVKSGNEYAITGVDGGRFKAKIHLTKNESWVPSGGVILFTSEHIGEEFEYIPASAPVTAAVNEACTCDMRYWGCHCGVFAREMAMKNG